MLVSSHGGKIPPLSLSPISEKTFSQSLRSPPAIDGLTIDGLNTSNSKKVRVNLPVQAGYQIQFQDKALQRDYIFKLNKVNVLASGTLRSLFRDLVFQLNSRGVATLQKIEEGNVPTSLKTITVTLENELLEPDAMLIAMHYLFVLNSSSEWTEHIRQLEKRCCMVISQLADSQKSTDKDKAVTTPTVVKMDSTSKNIKQETTHLATMTMTTTVPLTIDKRIEKWTTFFHTLEILPIFDKKENEFVFSCPVGQAKKKKDETFSKTITTIGTESIVSLLEEVEETLFALHFLWNQEVLFRVLKAINFLQIKRIQNILSFFLRFFTLLCEPKAEDKIVFQETEKR